MEEQEHSHISMGQQVNYARGINSFVQMVEHWDALAFIRDLNSNNTGFPFFTETERTHELFTYKEVPVSDISHNQEDDETTIPVFFISECREKISQRGSRGLLLAQDLTKKAFKKIKTKVRTHDRTPRSGGRSRR